MESPAMLKPSTTTQLATPSSRVRGFSLTELVVVVGLIMVMLAVSLPAVARYIRNYRVRAGASQVVGELTAARGKAIMKNVNYGVIFVILSPTTYRYAVEENPNSIAAATVRPTNLDVMPAATTTTTSTAGSLKTLPQGVTFGTNCNTATGNVQVTGLRYNRFGSICRPGVDPTFCPALTIGMANAMSFHDTTGATICVQQDQNNDGIAEIRRTITIAPGGRAKQQ
jgi:Tfp pilus assembly protein FimT